MDIRTKGMTADPIVGHHEHSTLPNSDAGMFDLAGSDDHASSNIEESGRLSTMTHALSQNMSFQRSSIQILSEVVRPIDNVAAEVGSVSSLCVYSLRDIQPRINGNIVAGLLFWTNRIKTYKYEWCSMFFMVLIKQLLIPANAFFVAMGVLQLVPAVSDAAGVPTYFVPVSFVVLVSLIKDMYEDINKHVQDKNENNRLVTRMCRNHREEFEQVPVECIRPGDLVKVFHDEVVPADLVILSSSDEYGIAYINTVQLDGETNTKTKICIPELKGVNWQLHDIKVSYPQVSPVLNSFSGSLTLLPREQDASTKTLHRKGSGLLISSVASSYDETAIPETRWYKPWSYIQRRKAMNMVVDHNKVLVDSTQALERHILSVNQLLPRGSSLVNTEWVIGIAVYTGNHTKIYQNTYAPRNKTSKLLLSYNGNSKFLLLAELLICSVLSVAYAIQACLKQNDFWYLAPEGALEFRPTVLGMSYAFLVAFGRHILLLSYFIPITLLVQIEIARWFEGYFLTVDQNTGGVSVNTLSIIEDLGCITHIFTDKTGTLTRNIMEFNCFGVCDYVMEDDIGRRAPKKYSLNEDSDAEETALYNTLLESCEPGYDVRYRPNQHVSFDSRQARDDLIKEQLVDREKLRMFLLLLSVCHTVLPKPGYQLNYERAPKNIAPATYGTQIGFLNWTPTTRSHYDASSPDELALVSGAKHFGVEFIRRPTLNSVELALLTKCLYGVFFDELEMDYVTTTLARMGPHVVPTITFEIVEILEFDSVRKRMSVFIVDKYKDYLLLSKGADSAIMTVLNPDVPADYIAHLNSTLSGFAHRGLRTLSLAAKTVHEAEARRFITSIENLKISCSEDNEAYQKAYEKLEYGFDVIGCTGISDMLQEDVPETISAIRDAGIKLWVLTGDKVETAISIAHSSNLLSQRTYNIILNETDVDSLNRRMEEIMAFVVAGQLAQDAFESVLSKSETDHYGEPNGDSNIPRDTHNAKDCDDGENQSTRNRQNEGVHAQKDCRIKWPACIKKHREKIANSRRKIQNSRLNMSLNEFIEVIRSAGNRNCIQTPVNGHLIRRQLSPEEVEYLVSVYIKILKEEGQEKDTKKSLFRGLLGSNDNSPSGRDVGADNLTNDGPKKIGSDSRSHGSQIVIDEELNSVLSTSAVEKYNSISLTVTGDTVATMFSNANTRQFFFGLAHLCSTVIACRLTPKQKAELISYNKKYTPTSNVTSLAIGDGANDVSMIVVADVGVGIVGKEGSQASRVSDISVNEFRALRNLLMVQGHQVLRRHSNMLYLTIFKNLLFATQYIWFGLSNGLSAADMYSPYLKQLFNLLFTPWALMSMSVFDRPIPYDVLLRCPSLYPTNQAPAGDMYYGNLRFYRWFIFSFVGGILIYSGSYILAHTTSLGLTPASMIDIRSFGSWSFMLVVICSLIVTLPYTTSIFSFTLLAWLLGLGSFIVCWYLETRIFVEAAGSFNILQLPLSNLAALLVSLLFTAGIVVIWKYRVIFNPTANAVIRERVKIGVFDVAVFASGRGDNVIVVPRIDNPYTGFAYVTSDSRFSLQRKSLSRNLSVEITGDM